MQDAHEIVNPDLIRLSSIIFSAEDAIISRNIEGLIDGWNPAAERIFGFTSAEALGQHISMIIPPRQQEREDQLAIRVLNGERVGHFSASRLTKGGRKINVSLSISPVHNKDGSITGLVLIARDISSWQKQAEEKQAMLAAIVNSADDAIISKNLDGFITSWNPGAQAIFGYTEEEVIGKHITILIPPEKRQEEDYIISCITKGRKVEHFQTTRITKYGKEIKVSLTVSPVKNRQGQVIGASKIARDITEQVAIQAQLEQQTEKLKELNRAKDEFIGMASHELKTPLTSIKAYVQLLERQFKGEAQTALSITKTLRHVNKLSGLISDLLDVSKIEAGKLQLDFTTFPLGAFLLEVIDSVQHTTVTHVIECKCDIGELNVYADRERIEQVLTNLLTNAAKYSPKADKIVVGAVRTGNDLIVSVRDFGIGIPQAELDDVFSRFYRVKELHPSFSGLGIGLFISQEIIQRHHGRIWVESQEGSGSTFYFSIPAFSGKEE